MIKKLLTILFILLLPCLSWGWGTMIMGGGVPAAPASCGAGTELLCENFDGSTACGDGSHTNCNNTWTVSGAPTFDFNYATAPAPLEGTYSFRINMSTGDDETGWYKAFTASDAVHFFYIVNAHLRTLSNINFMITDSAGALLMAVNNAGYEFNIMCGTVNAYSATTMAVDTTYYIWGDYTKGTGANAVCHLFHSTDTTKGAADITITNGDATGQAARAVLYQSSIASNDFIMDKIRVGTSAFGDNPQ